jgi:hypothetical protein
MRKLMKDSGSIGVSDENDSPPKLTSWVCCPM